MEASVVDEPSSPRQTRLRRTWPQRLTIATAIVAAVGCFATGSILYAAQRVVEDRNIVVLDASPEQDPGAPGTFESWP